MMMVRRRQPDGTLGPLEPLFPEVSAQVDEAVLVLLEAMAGLQEQVEELKAEVKAAKGGAE
ncbi:hypothetical protein NCCP2716_01030 [Sporosarcina sp. NCCP-2716]|uniref:hypothetical protein n=1 Tax=Sporosarcina sp. NCCP-2716 TaxID=2943679 RepID=UPI00203EBAA9|nr:hypothetical protein [Sporosarcina sp. NCCP-2716]GKV67605.1 hypothetical protein NCCP2716_01030 [Sporosarcina sp. NCCP-2716]